MEQYIPKSALVVEIEKLKGKVYDGSSYCYGWQHSLRMLELSLDTLEVKEVGNVWHDASETPKGLVDINSVCGWIITHINDYLIEGSILGTPCSTIDTDDLVEGLHKAFKS